MSLVRPFDLGVNIGRWPRGPHAAITDVPEVRVGHSTIVSGTGPLVPGQGPVRTGVTAIHAHAGSSFQHQVPAAVAVLNGAGELTGRSQIDEYGTLESPILLTSTHEVGNVHRAAISWMAEREALSEDFVIPVVAETWDGFLSDVVGSHVTEAHVFAALDGASGGPVARGNVGSGTGMALFGFKGGIGTSSRRVELQGTTFTVGVLVQGNYGRRHQLRVDGVPVGLRITDLEPVRGAAEPAREGSVIVVVATDAPLGSRQLSRLARRAMLGIGRTGGIGGHTSGDLMLAFSNHPDVRVPRRPPPQSGRTVPLVTATSRLHDAYIDPIFEAVIEATEEAVIDAMVAATTSVGRDGNTLFALPHDRLAALMASR